MVKRTALALTLAAVAAWTVPSFAQTPPTPAANADSQWDNNHPRRDQVNDRLHNQNRRITQQVKEGDLTTQQARKLRKEDRQTRQEERDMASQNGGHITKQEQRTLNQQENAVSRQIGR